MHKQLSPFITVSVVRGLQAEVVRQGSALRSQPRGTRHSNLLRWCPKPSISKALGHDLSVAFAIPDRLISGVFTYFSRRSCWGVGNTWSVVNSFGLLSSVAIRTWCVFPTFFHSPSTAPTVSLVTSDNSPDSLWPLTCERTSTNWSRL